MADTSDIAQLKMEAKTTLKASDIHIHDFSFEGKKTATAGDDLFDLVARAARQASQNTSATALKMGAIDVDFGGLRVDLGDETPEGVLLREAKGLINEENFESALAKLDEVFAIDQYHHEATYLKGFCLFKLGRRRASLLTLLKLKDAAVSNRLKTRIRCLKEEIRQDTVPTAAKAYAKAAKTKNAAKVIEPLREFSESDPEVGKFHYFLAGALLIDKKFMEARDAAYHGLEVCETNRDELQQLYEEIDRHLLPKLLAPARDFFRTRKYPDAARALAEVPQAVHSAPLWQTFNGYIEQLNGKGSGGLFSSLTGGHLTTGDPPGTPSEVKELFEYLVEPEMKAARTAVSNNQFDAAERSLDIAVSCTPSFSVANHMLATCVYKRVGSTVKQRIGKDLDDSGARELRKCKEELDSAKDYAVISSRDTEIADGKRLLASIDKMCNEIEEVVEKHEVQTHDAKIVNKLIDDFIEVLVQVLMLNAATNPRQIKTQAEELYSRLSRMRNELPAMRRRCKGDQAREIIDLVRDNFVEPNFTQLRRAFNR